MLLVRESRRRLFLHQAWMDRHDLNPYASPRAPVDAQPEAQPPPGLAALAWRVLVAWERLRLVYLAWLSLVSLAIFALVGIDALPADEFRFWAVLFVGFLGANICFTAGHAVELAAALLGMPPGGRRWLRAAVFLVGTAGATVLTLMWIALAAGDF